MLVGISLVAGGACWLYGPAVAMIVFGSALCLDALMPDRRADK
jgi:hypothetical protein